MPRPTEPRDAGQVAPAGRLTRAPVLRRLDPAVLADLAGWSTVRTFEHGQVVLSETCHGSPSDGIVAILAFGWCTATRSRPDGSRSAIAVARVGELVGIERLVSPGAEPPLGLAAWLASGDVVAVRLPAEKVRRAVESNGAARGELVRCLAERVAQAEELLADRSLRTDERLLRTLLRLSDGLGPRPIPLTQGELGELIGSTRETVNRSLGRLVDAGVVGLRDGRPVVLHRSPLQGARSGNSGLLGRTLTCQNPPDRPGRGAAARAGDGDGAPGHSSGHGDSNRAAEGRSQAWPEEDRRRSSTCRCSRR